MDDEGLLIFLGLLVIGMWVWFVCILASDGTDKENAYKNQINHLKYQNCVLTHELHKDRLIVCPAP